MANKYVGAAQFVGEKIIKPIVKSFTKKQKTTGTEVIKSVSPNVGKPSKSALNKDGKITKADILMGRGVIGKKKKKKKMKTAKSPMAKQVRQS